MLLVYKSLCVCLCVHASDRCGLWNNSRCDSWQKYRACMNETGRKIPCAESYITNTQWRKHICTHSYNFFLEWISMNQLFWKNGGYLKQTSSIRTHRVFLSALRHVMTQAGCRLLQSILRFFQILLQAVESWFAPHCTQPAVWIMDYMFALPFIS